MTRQSAQRGSKRTPPTTVRLDPELDAWVRAAQKNFGGQSALINAAVRFARAIERGTSYTVIPWQMGVVAKLMRLLPNPVFDVLFARAGRKARGLDL